MIKSTARATCTEEDARRAMNPLTWRQKAAGIIKMTLDTLPKDTDENTVNKAIDAAYPWGVREMYPYMVWRQEAKKARDWRFRQIAPKARKQRVKVPAFDGEPGLDFGAEQ